MSLNYFQIHTDGGSRGNPGPAAAAFVIHDHNQKLIHTGGAVLGITTNNVAEYQGVILALNFLINKLSNQPINVQFFLDSLLVVEQLKGNYKIKEPHLRELAQEIFQLIAQHQLTVTYQHVPRSQNTAADAEVNRLLDAHA